MPAKPSLGLYFSDNFIEVSQISQNGLVLNRFNQLPLPIGAVQKGEIQNGLLFAQTLQQLFLTAKPTPLRLSEEIVLGISDSRVFLRVFTVPNIVGKNINDAIEYQVRSLLQVMPGGVESDWQIIGKDDDGQIEVLLAAVPREIIDTYVSVCSSVGLRVIAVEPAIIANIRNINEVELQGKNQLLVYLGETYGTFSYLTSGNPRFSELLSTGEIQTSGGLAKAVLTHINFANSKASKRPVQEIIVSSPRTDIDSLTGSLSLPNIFATKAISKITTSRLPGLPLLRTSHGLGLKLLDNKPSLNILPLEYRLEVIRQRLVSAWQTVINVLIIFTALSFLTLYYFYKITSDHQFRLSQDKTARQQQLNQPESQELVKQAEDINKIIGRLMTLRTIVGGEEVVLKELSTVTPPGLNLTSFVVTRNPASKTFTENSSWILTGKAESRSLVLNFYNNLIKFPEFKDGQLYFGSLEKEVGLTFRIASKLQNEN